MKTAVPPAPRHALATPYPLMPLGPAARAGLIGLRLLLGAITVMALYAFLHGALTA